MSTHKRKYSNFSNGFRSDENILSTSSRKVARDSLSRRSSILPLNGSVLLPGALYGSATNAKGAKNTQLDSKAPITAVAGQRRRSSVFKRPEMTQDKINDTVFRDACYRVWNTLKSTIDPYFEQYHEKDEDYKRVGSLPVAKRHKDNNKKRRDSLHGFISSFMKPAGRIESISESNEGSEQTSVSSNSSSTVSSRGTSSSSFGSKVRDVRTNRTFSFSRPSSQSTSNGTTTNAFAMNEKKSISLNKETLFADQFFKKQDLSQVAKIPDRRKSVYGSSIARTKSQGRSRRKSSMFSFNPNETSGFDKSAEETTFNPVLPSSFAESQSFVSNTSNSTTRPWDLTITKVRVLKKPVSKVGSIDQLLVTPKFAEYTKILEQKRKLEQNVLKLRKSSTEGKHVVRALTPEQLNTVELVWKLEHSSGRKVMTSLANIDITIADLCTLKERNWLNDNIMDSYLSMVVERNRENSNLPNIFVFSTHFYSTLSSRGYAGVRRWAKRQKINVVTLDYVFIPVNVMNTHWSFAVINNKDKKFAYYDSLNGSGDQILVDLRHYMKEEWKRLYPDKPANEFSDYKLVSKAKFPKQQNGSDCGVFACTGISYLSRNMDLVFGQGDMPIIRAKMAYEILERKLLD